MLRDCWRSVNAIYSNVVGLKFRTVLNRTSMKPLGKILKHALGLSLYSVSIYKQLGSAGNSSKRDVLAQV